MAPEEVQMACMQLIAAAGEAHADFYNAIEKARKLDFDGADADLTAGKKAIAEGHKAQIELLAAEGKGELGEIGLLLVHSQDHLMGAMMFETVAREFVTLYRDGLPERSAHMPAAEGGEA